jgi:predicted nucleotidyltransferase
MSHTLQLGDAQGDENKLADLCRHYDVRELSLFGSAVRGEMQPGSDIDVMVEFDPGARIGLLKFESLSDDIDAPDAIENVIDIQAVVLHKGIASSSTRSRMSG